ncbi:MAG: aspartyl/asparaginyl beta-hydroxylase domain-containing protein [Pseudomonadota bacterium]
MPVAIRAIIERAENAESFGRLTEAAELWAELAEIAPNHPRLLVRDALELVKKGDYKNARDMLENARASELSEASIPLHLGLVHKLMGDLPKSLSALDDALAIDVYLFMAHLWKGAVLEQMGNKKAAAATYKNALKIAPPPEKTAPQINAAIAQARKVVADNARALQEYMRAKTEGLRRGRSQAEMHRADECLDIFAGVKKQYFHEGILMNMPQLPAIQFWNREYFPWLEELEAATPIVQEEAQAIIKHRWDTFSPYVQHGAGVPLNQWEYLNHNSEWSTVHFYRDGKRFDEVHELCPRTSAILDKLPLAHQPNFGPTVVFSVLQPHTRIPAHTGSTNTRLLCHLPLKIPPNCGFRCGNEIREWKIGEAFVFDDSIDHEAWNDSDEVRYIMIADVWNPLLTQLERDMVDAILLAKREYDLL